MAIEDYLVMLAVGLGKLVLAIILAVLAQYIAIRMFDWLTKDIDEMAELKKGNVAIAVVLAAVVLSVATIIGSGISAISIPLTFDLDAWIKLISSFGVLVVAIVLAVIAQFLALNIFDKLTKGIDEQLELKKGNVAVAIVLGAIMFSIAQVIQSGLPKF
jgi:uncharacterized membrane protein YjfL (UPF0719 family)